MLQELKRNVSNSEGEMSAHFSGEECQAMQRAVLRLFDHWGVNDADSAVILGGLSTKTLQRWRAGEYGRVGRDLGDRLSNLLGIHKALRIIFADQSRGYRWMGAANDAFGGLSALDVLKRGGMEDLIRLRRYLDASRGGW